MNTLRLVVCATWGRWSQCVAFSPTGYTTLSIHKQILKNCKHATNIWTNSLVCRSLCRILARIECLWFRTTPLFPPAKKKKKKRQSSQNSSLVLICHQVNTQRRTWTAGVNWFQLSCAHTMSGPSSSRCTGRPARRRPPVLHNKEEWKAVGDKNIS